MSEEEKQGQSASGAVTGETAAKPDSTEEVKRLTDEIGKLKHELLLQRADFDNARKRLERLKQEEIKYSAMPMVRELVTVLDSLELSLNHAAEDDPMRKGVVMVLNGMMKALSNHHVHRIQAKGKKFDPSLHEAVSMVCDVGTAEDTVVEETRPGYLYHDRLVRPTGVIVNRHPSPPEEAPADTPTLKE